MEDPAVGALREARRALDEVIAEIQRVPGFEDFLATPTFDDVAEAATEAPLAYLAAAQHGGLALVVRGDDVTHIDLPGLGREPLEEAARQYLDSYTVSGMPRWRTGETGTPPWPRSPRGCGRG